MIEAFISARVQGEVGLKKRGDILVVKLAGSPWGKEERAAVVEWDDPLLEAELLALQAAGEPFPFIINPYAAYETVITKVKGKDGKPVDIPHKVLVNRSKVYVDIDSMTLADKQRIESRSDAYVTPISVDAFDAKERPTTETKSGTPIDSRPVPTDSMGVLGG